MQGIPTDATGNAVEDNNIKMTIDLKLDLCNQLQILAVQDQHCRTRLILHKDIILVLGKGGVWVDNRIATSINVQIILKTNQNRAVATRFGHRVNALLRSKQEAIHMQRHIANTNRLKRARVEEGKVELRIGRIALLGDCDKPLGCQFELTRRDIIGTTTDNLLLREVKETITLR